MLWGHSVAFWDGLGFWLMVGGAGVGALALLITFASSIILYRVTNVQQDQLRLETAAFAERTEKLKVESAELRLELERLKLPRKLSLGQINALIAALAPLKGQLTGKIEITSADDHESRRYAGDFMNVFTALYIIPNVGSPPKTPTPRSREFSVFINADVALETSDPVAAKLVWPISQAFKAAGLVVAHIGWELVPHGHVVIVIPPKITWKEPGTHPPGGP